MKQLSQRERTFDTCTSLFVFALLLFAVPVATVSTAKAQESEGAWDKIKQGVGSALESKEEKYRREQLERDQAAKRQEVMDTVLQQQEELKQIEEEKRRILQQGPSAQSPRKRGNTDLNRPGYSVPASRWPRSSAGSTDVELFVASKCDDCLKAVGFLDGAGISYRVYNLETNRNAEQEYYSSVGRGIIPAIRIGSVVIRGYNPQELRRLTQTTAANLNQGAAASTAKTVAPEPETAAQEDSDQQPSPNLPPAAGEENQFDISESIEKTP